MRRASRAILAAFALVAFAGCIHHHHHGQRVPGHVIATPGPPPHAPAHGYRHKHHHHGVELVFDSHLGVYVVVGLDDHYFHDGHYYRLVGERWQVSARLDSGWKRVRTVAMPKGLAKKRGHAKGKGHGKWKHHPPAKHGY